MSAFLTSKKDLSTISFLWGQFFADSKKESFEKLLSDSFKNIDIKNHTAKLLEFNLEMEDIVFEFLLDTNLESLKARYSDCRDKNRNDLIESWTSENMIYENPKLGKISNKEIEEIIGSYTYQSCEHKGFKTSTGFFVNYDKLLDRKIQATIHKYIYSKASNTPPYSTIQETPLSFIEDYTTIDAEVKAIHNSESKESINK